MNIVTVVHVFMTILLDSSHGIVDQNCTLFIIIVNMVNFTWFRQVQIEAKMMVVVTIGGTISFLCILVLGFFG